jgi:hypothetical protein
MLSLRPITNQEDKLRGSLTICLPTFDLFAPALKAQEKLPLKLIVTTPLPGFTGDLVHFGPQFRLCCSPS